MGNRKEPRSIIQLGGKLFFKNPMSLDAFLENAIHKGYEVKTIPSQDSCKFFRGERMDIGFTPSHQVEQIPTLDFCLICKKLKLVFQYNRCTACDMDAITLFSVERVVQLWTPKGQIFGHCLAYQDGCLIFDNVEARKSGAIQFLSSKVFNGKVCLSLPFPSSDVVVIKILEEKPLGVIGSKGVVFPFTAHEAIWESPKLLMGAMLDTSVWTYPMWDRVPFPASKTLFLLILELLGKSSKIADYKVEANAFTPLEKEQVLEFLKEFCQVRVHEDLLLHTASAFLVNLAQTCVDQGDTVSFVAEDGTGIFIRIVAGMYLHIDYNGSKHIELCFDAPLNQRVLNAEIGASLYSLKESERSDARDMVRNLLRDLDAIVLAKGKGSIFNS